MAGEDSQLKVGVGTTYDGSGIDAANKAISGFTKTSENNLDNLAKSAKNSSNALSQGLAKAASATATSGRAIAKGGNEAAFALTNLGRVAQDAPFGFLGIQNNLNPLLESFQRLRAETGSNKAALSALTASLLGPAGLGIALSVVGAAILLYQQYQQKSARADDEKEKAQRKVIDANDAYFKSLSSINQIKIKGDQDAQKELISLDQLYFAARNVKLSMEERYKAAAALQDQYPNTFNNFSKEQIALGKASQAYKGLADDILSVARAAAATNIITENTKKLILEQNKFNKLKLSQKKAQEDLNSEIEKEKNLQGQVAEIGERQRLLVASNMGASANPDDLIAIEKRTELDEVTKQLNATQKEKTRLVKENLDIQKLVNREVEKEGVVALVGLDKSKEKVEKAKEFKTLIEILAELSAQLKQNDLAFSDTFNEKRINDISSYQKAIDDLIKNGFSPASSAVQRLIDKQNELSKLIKGNQLGNLPDSNTNSIDNPQRNLALPYLNLKGITTGLSEYIKLMQEAYRSNERFSESVKELATSTLESGLSQAFGAIGQSLAEGTNAIDAFGSSLLSAFAGFLSQLGQMFIKEGIAQIGYGIAKNLILPGSGANNIAGGLGMIGAGAAISIIGGAAGAAKGGKGNYQNVKQVRGFASGVQGFGGGMALVGERGPELLQLPQGSNVIPNPQTRQFMSGQNGVVINGSFDIGLEKLYLRLEQTGKRLNRRT